MTHRVNLLPGGRQRYREQVTRVRCWMAVDSMVVLLVVAAIGVALALRPTTSTTHAAIDELDVRIRDAQTQLRELGPKLTRDRKTLEAIRHVGDQPDWSILLALLSRLRDEQAVLRSVRIEPMVVRGGSMLATAMSVQTAQGTDGPSLRRPTTFAVLIEGLAQSQAEVSRIVLTCEQAGLFDAVKLISTSPQMFMGRQVTRFELQGRLGAVSDHP